MVTLRESDIQEMVIDLCIKYSHQRCTRLALERMYASWQKKDLVRVISEIGGIFGVSLLQVRVTFAGAYFFDPERERTASAKIRIGHLFEKHHLIYKQSEASLFQDGFPAFVFMTAHEMAHTRLYMDNHPLKVSEPATDILAMVMGFDGAFETLFLRTFETVGYLSRRQASLALAQVRERVQVTYLRS